MILEYYLDKARRDAEARILRNQGLNVTTRTVRNCVLNPHSVRDFTGHTSPNGFGGAADQWFTRLYKIEAR